MRIKIKIPEKNKKWQVTFLTNGKYSAASRTTAANLYAYLEMRFLRFSKAKLPPRTHLVVDYGIEHPREPNWRNEIHIREVRELLYALACFLEDYLTITYQKSKYKEYGGEKN